MNEYELTKAQAKEKMNEKIFEALLEYAATCHVENIVEENQTGEEDLVFTPSPEFNRRMKKLIAKNQRREQLKRLKTITVKFLMILHLIS